MATSSKENLLRFWHLKNDENYVLRLSDLEIFMEGTSLTSDKIVKMDYSEKSKLLVGGTTGGKIIFWKNISGAIDSPYEEE